MITIYDYPSLFHSFHALKKSQKQFDNEISSDFPIENENNDEKELYKEENGKEKIKNEKQEEEEIKLKLDEEKINAKPEKENKKINKETKQNVSKTPQSQSSILEFMQKKNSKNYEGNKENKESKEKKEEKISKVNKSKQTNKKKKNIETTENTKPTIKEKKIVKSPLAPVIKNDNPQISSETLADGKVQLVVSYDPLLVIDRTDVDERLKNEYKPKPPDKNDYFHKYSIMDSYEPAKPFSFKPEEN